MLRVHYASFPFAQKHSQLQELHGKPLAASLLHPKRGLAVADATIAAESKAESLANPSDIEHLGDDGVGVNLHHHARGRQ